MHIHRLNVCRIFLFNTFLSALYSLTLSFKPFFRLLPYISLFLSCSTHLSHNSFYHMLLSIIVLICYSFWIHCSRLFRCVKFLSLSLSFSFSLFLFQGIGLMKRELIVCIHWLEKGYFCLPALIRVWIQLYMAFSISQDDRNVARWAFYTIINCSRKLDHSTVQICNSQ